MSRKWKIDFIKINIVCLLSLNACIYIELMYRKIPFLKPLVSDIPVEFLYTSWQIQASLAALVIALFSIIQGRIDDNYYGLSLRQVLFLPKGKSCLSLSYWEKTIVILIMIIIPGIFITIKLFAGVLIIEIWSLFLLLLVTKDSLEVFTQSDKYNKIAKAYSDNLLLTPCQENIVEAKSHVHNLGKAAESMLGTIAYPEDNDQLSYLFSIVENKSTAQVSNNIENNYFNEIRIEIFSTVFKILELSIDLNLNRYVKYMYPKVAKCFDVNIRRQYNMLMLRSYHEAKISFNILQSLIRVYEYSDIFNIDVEEDLLIIGKYAVDRNDDALFRELIAMLSRRLEFSDKEIALGRVVLIITVYLYYYCLRETLVRKSSSKDKSRFITMDIRETGSPVSLRDICRKKSSILFHNIAYVLKYFSKDPMVWEIMLEGEAKFLQIHSIAIEFFAFYLVAVVPAYLLIEHPFEETMLDDSIEILKITHSLKSNDKDTSDKYKLFCEWMGVRTPQPSMETLPILENVIKDQLYKQNLGYKVQSNDRHNKIKSIKHDVLKSVKENPLYGIPHDDTEKYEVVQKTYTLVDDYRAFSSDASLIGFDEGITNTIQRFLFAQVESSLKKLEVIGRDSAQEDYDQFIHTVNELKLRGVSIDTVFNYPIYEVHKYFENNVFPETLEIINSLKKSIKMDGFWKNNMSATIYLDSSIGIPRFFFSKNFIELDEEIPSDQEIIEWLDKYSRQKDGSYFVSSQARHLAYTKEEAVEYYKATKFKIRFTFQLYIPKKTAGFYTIYQKPDID